MLHEVRRHFGASCIGTSVSHPAFRFSVVS